MTHETTLLAQLARSRQRLRRLVAEPVVIFVLLAAGIFAYDALSSDGSELYSSELDRSGPDAVAGEALETIVVSDEIVSALESDFEWLNGRPPSEDESRRLVRQWIDDEIVFRKALAARMHVNDSKVRAHLVDKLHLLWGGSPEPPSEAELFEFYVDHIDEYYTETRISFEQVFFTERPERSDSILARLAAGETIVGDGHWLGDHLDRYAESILRTSFGGEFYERLLSAAPGEWIGPLESSRGHHFVRVTEVTEPEPIPYAELRERLVMDFIADAREKRIDAMIAELRDGFEIVIERETGSIDSGLVESATDKLVDRRAALRSAR
jgi:hypothetical protein